MSGEPATPAAGIDKAWHKVVAGVFATVVAPVLVAFGVKFSDKVLTPAKEEAKPVAAAPAEAKPATPPATQPAAPQVAATAPASIGPASVATATPPARPAVASGSTSGSPAPAATGTPATTAPAATDNPGDAPKLPHFTKPNSHIIRLFNGRDLTGFYTYLGRVDAKTKPLGKNDDPQHVFSVKDGVLRISGEVPGVLETVKDYEDYWLTLEYKWGDQTWAPHASDARRSGLLVNIQGPDGVLRGVWPAAVHVQMMEGSSGDFVLPAAKAGDSSVSLTVASEEKPGPKQPIISYMPHAPHGTYAHGVIKRFPPTPWQDIKGYHPAGDVDKAPGEWNTLECVCLNGKILVQINGQVVNFAIETSSTSGRIGLQSNGAELFVRELTLQPYMKHHKASAE